LLVVGAAIAVLFAKSAVTVLAGARRELRRVPARGEAREPQGF
jgi:hypothetical protein